MPLDMKTTSLLLLFLTFGFSISQCKKENNLPAAVDFTCAEQPLVCDLTAANGNFAIEVFKQINSEEPAEKNIFISPFSISTALTMTVNGAANQTLADMQNTLKIASLGMKDVNASYKTLLQTLPNLDPDTKIKLANSIWHQLNYSVLPGFLTANSTYFNSDVKGVEFKDPAVIGKVNMWIEDNTDGLIKDALSELDPNTVMLLINAIYFKGTWRTEFKPDSTQKADFFTAGGPVQVDMMHIQESKFPYFSNDLFQAIDLPYGDSIYSMSVFLPKEGHDVGEIVAALNAGSWGQWLDAFQTRSVQLYLPKFKLEYDKKLKRTLTDMGMGIAFSDAADFSSMINGGGVKIDDVIHKAFIEVNEKGTEAAAVTIVSMIEISVPFVPTVNVNRPFLFVIRDNKTNSILFMGKMMAPNA
ncbi:MAG: serpin family protein [Haliscomenobacteraceae bacterium CHB4]|nr:serpin family protein [Haliscomenobacteraceae bacterium CHB4]